MAKKAIKGKKGNAQRQTLQIVNGQLRVVKSTTSLIKKLSNQPKKSRWDAKYETYYSRARHLGIEKPLTMSNFKT